MTGSTPAVSIRNLAFRYPGAGSNTVENISIDVREGEFLSIIGPSGCGKTTLLNCVAGFSLPDAGEIRIRDEPVRDVAAGRAAFMFARDTLLPWRSASGNVELALIMRDKHVRKARRPAAEIASETASLLSRVGLTGVGSHHVDELSQGMRQRVALARTLAMDAPLILMDEPFGALDAQTRIAIQNEFLGVWERERRSVILITHDVGEAIIMSDRIVVLGGRPAGIVAEIPVDLPRPRNAARVHGESSTLFGEIWSKLEAASALSRQGS